MQKIQPDTKLRLVILGTLQDGGLPHLGCKKSCCTEQIANPDAYNMVVSLGVIDPEDQSTYLFEATPDLSRQVHLLNSQAGLAPEVMPSGVFATHAHIGHYTGLQYFGKEAKNANQVPVYAMPRMQEFLSTNGPWNQLVGLNNISIKPIADKQVVVLSDSLRVVPFRVPHRDEYSETVGFKIIGPKKSVLFIPDIDKWSLWEESIIAQIAQVDYAFLDGTFYHGQEIGTRDISQIPHPFIEESIALFKDLPDSEKAKIHFIHFNHTNPVLDNQSEAYQNCVNQGFKIANVLDVFNL
ncbi:MAG: MBL fold metallo-hydrolase [Gilvibacter sp.]